MNQGQQDVQLRGMGHKRWLLCVHCGETTPHGNLTPTQQGVNAAEFTAAHRHGRCTLPKPVVSP